MFKIILINCIFWFNALNALSASDREDIVLINQSHRNSKNILIVANGPYDQQIVEKYFRGFEVIALDGAATNLLKNGIIPKYVIGDFDSLRESLIKNFPDLNSPMQKKLFEPFFMAIAHFDRTWTTDELMFEEYQPGKKLHLLEQSVKSIPI